MDTGIMEGLSKSEADQRLKKYGYNEVKEKYQSPVLRLAKKFWGVTPWVLEITVVLTLIIGKYIDTLIVLLLLVFNGILGFVQEEKANAALALLQQKLSVMVKVKRDGSWATLPMREIVPGDVVRLRAGDIVPADARVSVGIVEVDESSLTGESLSVEKGPGKELFSGSVIKRGESTCVVTSTGVKTYYGRTIELVRIARPRLQTEEVISRIVKLLLIIVGVFLAAGIGISVYRGIEFIEVLPLVAILLVSAIPVALPTMFAISMALGSLELSKKGVLVTRLNASEDAATMDVLCVDKTGTLTYNRLSVAEAIPFGDNDENNVIMYGALASQEANQDPIDIALISEAKARNISYNGYTQTSFIPFDPSTKRTVATIVKDFRQYTLIKGAVNTVLPLCHAGNDEQDRARNEVDLLSKKGYRVLALAKDDDEGIMRIVGLIGLCDSPRTDSPRLISELNDMGISVKMLTGDALQVAREIAKQVGIGPDIALSSEFREGDKKGINVVESYNGFAEIYPEDKYLIVKNLQKYGHTVGMTGDGVNDAPALRQAEVGIAVSNATDIAKKASSVVITGEGLGCIVDLVKIGRMIYQRILTWILNKIVKTFQIVVFVILAFLLYDRFVVSIFSMVLLLFLTDFVTLSLSSDNVRYSQQPDDWNIGSPVRIAICLGVLMVIESLALLHLGLSYVADFQDIKFLQTFIFEFLVFSGVFNVLILRERNHFWHSMPGKHLLISVVCDVGIVLLISTAGILDLAPIDPILSFAVLAYSLIVCFVVNDLVKVFLMRSFWLS